MPTRDEINIFGTPLKRSGTTEAAKSAVVEKPKVKTNGKSATAQIEHRSSLGAVDSEQDYFPEVNANQPKEKRESREREPLRRPPWASVEKPKWDSNRREDHKMAFELIVGAHVELDEVPFASHSTSLLRSVDANIRKASPSTAQVEHRSSLGSINSEQDTVPEDNASQPKAKWESREREGPRRPTKPAASRCSFEEHKRTEKAMVEKIPMASPIEVKENTPEELFAKSLGRDVFSVVLSTELEASFWKTSRNSGSRRWE